jgi:hypothetical protein
MRREPQRQDQEPASASSFILTEEEAVESKKQNF